MVAYSSCQKSSFEVAPAAFGGCDPREAMPTVGHLCALALLATPPSSSVRETAESKLVEFFNGTLSLPKARVESALVSKAKGCLGTPPCSAHGKCHESKLASGGPSAFSCKCEGGYFGKDCAHKKHDCVRLQSCTVCQDPANAKFCGWCADGRYCVPKHVHSALMQDGQGAAKKRQCGAWYEDSCPAPKRVPRPPGNGTLASGAGDDGFMDLDGQSGTELLRVRVKTMVRVR